MNTKPVVIVAGLGRCGMTLVMNMLATGGMECAGFAPDYEDERASIGPLGEEWFSSLAGMAMKLHDPHINTPPQSTPSVSIWLDRNPKEQARSRAKFTHLLAGMPLPDRAHMLRWRRGLVAERMAARESLRKSSRVILTLSFETILMNPRNAAWMLAEALKQWTQLDIHAMSLVVARRGPECKPDLSFEIGLMRQFT